MNSTTEKYNGWTNYETWNVNPVSQAKKEQKMKRAYTVTGYADVQPKGNIGEMTIKVWADLGPRGRIIEVRGYNTVTWDDGKTQTEHGDIFKNSEWANFYLADLDPQRSGDNATLPEFLKVKLRSATAHDRNPELETERQQVMAQIDRAMEKIG